MLGKLWRERGEKGACAQAWDIGASCACPKGEKPSPFCRARTRWIELAVEAGREIVEGEWGLVYSMTASEWDATGLTLKVDIPEAGGLVSVGSKESISMADLAYLAMSGKKEGLRDVLAIQRVFPDARIEVQKS